MAPSTELRLTPQRRAVLRVLTSSADHPTATEVRSRMRAASPGIGAATSGFAVTSGDLQFRGLCPDCARRPPPNPTALPA